MKVDCSQQGASSSGILPWGLGIISQLWDAEKTTVPREDAHLARTKCLEVPEGSLKPGRAYVILGANGNSGTTKV